MSAVVAETVCLEGKCEVCASAEGIYEEGEGRMAVKLDCYLRPRRLTGKGATIHADWLPHAETVAAWVPPSDPCTVTKEAFDTWTKFVRKSIW